MEIEYGAQVVDRDGKVLGTVDYIMRDTWSGGISKFKVSTDLVETDLFYTPDDVSEATPARIKLKTAVK
ncbi:MAG: hypothetical protein HYX91_01345 [Chloroflexi bacterium]|nr:hypothetical protein [Chloroflexota bacterium]